MTVMLTKPVEAELHTGGLDEALTCTQVIEVTHDVKTFVLAPDDLRPLAFRPGQHLTLSLEIDGVPMQRCYTISSAPTRPGPLEITVKRVPGGPVSNWLHDRLVPGGRIWATGPHGEFSHTRHPAGKYLFLSAGSGITPLMSMLRTLMDSGPADVVFVHSARTPDDIIFRDELEAIAARGDVTVTVICEDDSSTEVWQGTRGRLGLRTLIMVPDLHAREVFTCGPPGYMTATRELLSQAAVEPTQCHEESFDLTARAGSTDDDAPDIASSQRYAVEFRRSGFSVECGDQETLLHAAHRAGLKPPSMCTEGMCGTCRSSLLAGQVDMQHAGGIRQRDIDQGEILICCSKPLGDVVVDI